MRDELTGVDTGEMFSLCIRDVDRFKQGSDAYGHLAGDAVLTKLPEQASRRKPCEGFALVSTAICVRYRANIFLGAMEIGAGGGARR
jgi:GGDEF domain-containing protein